MTCHHTYSTPIFEMEVGNSEFSYLMFYDHDIIEGSFNQAKVFDLTQYPKTINPMESPKASLNKLSTYVKQEVIGFSHEDGKDLNNTIFF